jgi:hypothetical protein
MLVETGYDACLRYLLVANGRRLKEYRYLAREVVADGEGGLPGMARQLSVPKRESFSSRCLGRSSELAT